LTRVPARSLVAGMLLLAAAVAGGCGRQSSAGPAGAQLQTLGPQPAAAAAGGGAKGPVLSASQLAGEHVIYSYSGLTPPAKLLSLISRGKAAGVIFFGDNIASRAQIAAVIERLERANASASNPVRAPLLLMTDQEGGLIRRLSGAPALSEKQIGAASRPAQAATLAGSGAARNLRSAGMNVNLAPVLDVYRSAGNFVDHRKRSYSKRPQVVSALAANFIVAQQQLGVAATAKHFPGLGAATRLQNTDLQAVILNTSRPSLAAVDESPYKSAVAAGVRLVMVSWATYPQLDPSVPAGLSSTIIRGQLRQQIGFRGVTISDALEAGALRAYGSIQRRAVLATAAGIDLVLCSHGHVSEGEKAMAALQRAYQSGMLSRSAFRESAQRVIDLRASLGSVSSPTRMRRPIVSTIATDQP
jgi:beta-N-acetylhexosaminidase